jgi:glutamate racemase
MLKRYIAPLLAQGADTLVLGCTHYPLVQASIEQRDRAEGLRDVALVDTGDAVARQLARLLEAGGCCAPGADAAAGAPGRLHERQRTALSAAFSSLLGIDPKVHEDRAYAEPGTAGHI